jgi:hypothetical protein
MPIFENAQWVVNEYGLQSKKPGAPYEYNIPAERLLERAGAGRGDVYDWPLQLAEKTWVDIDAFIEAYQKALDAHAGRYKGSVDPKLLSQSLGEARQMARQH